MRKNLLRMIGVALVGSMGVSCSTHYDSYGSRRQSVNPAGVAVGAVVLGALAYSIGRNDGKGREHRRHTRFEQQHDYRGSHHTGRRDDYRGGRRR